MKLLLIVLFSVPLFAKAQNKSIVVEGESPNLFITHKVAAKENYYSIGRIYNISPKEVAPFNNLVLENGLSLGQSLKIPLVATNFLQTGNAAPLRPVPAPRGVRAILCSLQIFRISEISSANLGFITTSGKNFKSSVSSCE